MKNIEAMKRILFLCAFVCITSVFESIAQTQVIRDTIPCVNGEGKALAAQYVSINFRDDTIYIDGWLAANDCGEHYLAYEQWEDSISISVYDEFKGGIPCETSSLYPVKAKIGNCPGELYKVYLRNGIAGNYDKNAILKRSYKPLLTGDAIRWSFLGYFAIDTPLESYEFIAYGDTLINGQKYKHLVELAGGFGRWDGLESSIDEFNEFWKNYDLAKDSWFDKSKYCIRESSDGAKLLFFDKETLDEFVMSDLSLNEGDTLRSNPNLGDYKIVSSVSLENGMKRIDYPRGSYTDDFVMEGIGPSQWDYYVGGWANFFYCRHQLNCFMNSDVFVKTSRYSVPCGCTEPYVNIDDIYSDGLYIEMRDGALEVSVEDSRDVNIDLYHIGGQLVYKLTTGSSYIEIPTGNLPSGVYILSVTAEDGRIVGTRKIVI